MNTQEIYEECLRKRNDQVFAATSRKIKQESVERNFSVTVDFYVAWSSYLTMSMFYAAMREDG